MDEYRREMKAMLREVRIMRAQVRQDKRRIILLYTYLRMRSEEE